MPTPFKILTLGDSVMWGQGLRQPHKFVQLAVDALQSGGKQVSLAALPHSGAVLCDGPAPPAPHQDFLFGELPRSFPSISSQLAIAVQQPGYAASLAPKSWDPPAWVLAKQSLQQQIGAYGGPGGRPPDLILLDGGINDLGALQIAIPWNLGTPDPCGSLAAAAAGNVNRVMSAISQPAGLAAFDPADLAWMTEAEFKALVDRFVFDRMRPLVARVAQAFPKAQVILTGYFPIFTQGSLGALAAGRAGAMAAALLARGADREHLSAALAWGLHPALSQLDVANRIIEQSGWWYTYSTQRLQDVVNEANTQFGQRFSLAVPTFGDDNGALAPHSLLWTFTGPVDFVIQKILDLFGLGALPQGGAAVAPAAVAPEAAAQFLAAGVLGSVGFGLALAAGAAIATDEASGERIDAASRYYVGSSTGRSDPQTTLFEAFATGCASAGHPNREGAQAYFGALKALLP
jgi:lysophospholipase L1-like esterase